MSSSCTIFLGFRWQCTRTRKWQTLEMLPQDIKSARLCVSANRDNFMKYVCCPQCFSIYPWSNKPTAESSVCNFHYMQHRKPCGRKLYKEVKLSSGKVTYHPLPVYCYKSVTASLQEMLNRPLFLDHCEAWRLKTSTVMCMMVMCGKILWRTMEKLFYLSHLILLLIEYWFVSAIWTHTAFRRGHVSYNNESSSEWALLTRKCYSAWCSTSLEH